jgi:hypothetical protein
MKTCSFSAKKKLAVCGTHGIYQSAIKQSHINRVSKGTIENNCFLICDICSLVKKETKQGENEYGDFSQ